MLAGVVSDIHGDYDLLWRAVEAMGQIDLLLFAGDGCHEITRWQAENRSTRVEKVAGNCDYSPDCPQESVVDLGCWRVLLTHGHLYGAKTGVTRLLVRGRQLGVGMIVYGHTHRAGRAEHFGVILFNPGSLSTVRTPAPPSYGLIKATEQGLETSIHYL